MRLEINTCGKLKLLTNQLNHQSFIYLNASHLDLIIISLKLLCKKILSNG